MQALSIEARSSYFSVLEYSSSTQIQPRNKCWKSASKFKQKNVKVNILVSVIFSFSLSFILSLSYFHSQKVKAFPFLFEKKNGLTYMNTRSFSSSLIFISMCVFSFILSLPLSLFFLPSLFPFLPLFFRNLEMRSDLIFYFLHFYF